MSDKTEEVKADGYFYNENGEFLGKEGSSDKVYFARRYEKTKDSKTDKITIKYIEVEDLSITHDHFCYIGGIIKHEAGNNDITELKCIAFASHNEATNTKNTWRTLLASAYSSVPNKDSHKLKDNDESKTNNTRKSMISVLTKGEDITKGATFWDGTDFLAWGTNENKFDSSTKVGHNKFKEYKFIEIPKDVYDSFLAANRNESTTYTMKVAHDLKKCSGKHVHLTKKNKATGKDVYTGKIKYPMPASVFENTDYWSATCFYYDTGVKVTNGLSATIAAGKSVFWKKTKDRLCTDSSAKKEEEKTTIYKKEINIEKIKMPIDNTRVEIIKRKPLDLDIQNIDVKKYKK